MKETAYEDAYELHRKPAGSRLSHTAVLSPTRHDVCVGCSVSCVTGPLSLIMRTQELEVELEHTISVIIQHSIARTGRHIEQCLDKAIDSRPSASTGYSLQLYSSSPVTACAIQYPMAADSE